MRQSAAIPYRVDDDGRIHILLVTSRTRRRWIIPKGKIGARMLARRSAEREAFEEAGVLGRIAEHPVATYHQEAGQTAGSGTPISVDAYPLEVIDELPVWQEMHQRERRWFGLQEALRAVRDPEIRAAIRTFSRHMTRR